MPKDYEIVTPRQVAQDYYKCALNCNKVIRYELKKRGLSVPKDFLGVQIPQVIQITNWIKSRPKLEKIARYEREHDTIVDRPAEVNKPAWDYFNQFIVAEPYLQAKQGAILAYQSASKSRGLAIWTDVINGKPFDLWSINRNLITQWRNSTLSMEQINALSENQQQAYRHKLQDDEIARNHQRAVHKRQAVDKLQTRRLQIVSNILDSQPFYFSADVLAKSVDPKYILEHLTSDHRRYVDERAKHEIETEFG